MQFNDDDIRREAGKYNKKAEIYLSRPKRILRLLNQISKMKLEDDMLQDLKLLISLVKDYMHGHYRKIPVKAILSIIGAIVYVAAPADLIPDFLPLIGFTDDAAVVAFVINSIHSDVKNYADWKNTLDCNGKVFA